MTSFKAVVKDPVGMHARPASIATTEASKFKSDIIIKSGGKEGNLKSIMNVMALAIKTGSEFEIVATGDDEQQAIEAIEQVMKANNLI